MAEVRLSNGEEVCQELVGVGNVENAVTSFMSDLVNFPFKPKIF